MNLLDTNVFVWSVNEPEKLSPAARRVVETGDFSVSCASLWELLSKKGRRTALIEDPLPWWKTYVDRLGVQVLRIELDHVERLDVLPGPLRDPFDRILIAQSITNGLRLVTKDRVIRDHYQSHLNIVW